MVQKVVLSGEKFNIAQKVVISGKIIQHVYQMCFFLLKCWICWIMLDPIFEKMCFFLLKSWICWICWIILGLWKAKRDQNRPKIIQHIQHIQHFSRKKHFFRKRHSTWSNIFNISAERSTFLKKMLLSGEKFNMAPKSGSFSRKSSTWPKKWFFQQKKFNMCRKCVSFFWKSFFSGAFLFSSLSLSPSLSLSLYLRYLLLHFSTCVSLTLTLSLSLSLSLSLPFSIYCYLLSLFLDPPLLHSLSCLLSLSSDLI